MKKICLLILLLSIIIFTSCNSKPNNQEFSVIVPSGTPLLGISEYVVNHPNNVIVTSGSDELLSAWVNKTSDIIIMPVNLGSKLYNQTKNYVLYKTYVWGNLYLSSTNKLNSIEDINNQKIVVFGKNSTPDIIIQSLIKYYKLNVEIEYVSDVSQANAILLTSTDYFGVISAEPSLSALKQKKQIYTIDLQEEWKKITNNGSYPQAGIFVNVDLYKNNNLEQELNKLISSITNAVNSPDTFSEIAINAHQTFNTLGKDIIKSALPNCHFDVSKNKQEEKELIEFYFNKMIDLGFINQLGAIPNEEFYY